MGGSLYLVDRDTAVVYHVPARADHWPRLAGVKVAGGLQEAAAAGRAVDLFAALDAFLRSRRQRLKDVFDSFDTDGNGRLDPAELTSLLHQLIPGVSPSQDRYFRVMLGGDAGCGAGGGGGGGGGGVGGVTFDGLMAGAYTRPLFSST